MIEEDTRADCKERTPSKTSDERLGRDSRLMPKADAPRQSSRQANCRTKRSDYRLRNQILESITHRRTTASIRHLQDETRIPDNAQWREQSEEEKRFGAHGAPSIWILDKAE